MGEEISGLYSFLFFFLALGVREEEVAVESKSPRPLTRPITFLAGDRIQKTKTKQLFLWDLRLARFSIDLALVGGKTHSLSRVMCLKLVGHMLFLLLPRHSDKMHGC